MENVKNSYMEQVEAQQMQLEKDLRVNRKKKSAPRRRSAPEQELFVQQAANFDEAIEEDTSSFPYAGGGGASMMDTNIQNQAPDVRITGFMFWKTVVVPPNAYVVHTRKNHKEPLHVGLGISFSFNPYSDSFLVVPSAMQTILINAHCICKDLQGLLVQGYVQWIVDNFSVAYKKLDFTDAVDPMRIVNIQLREQAEAAIKDKVSTMGVDEVLSDKQPIIQELTSRIRNVAEGQGEGDEGLGLRIVTVQIKEAVVSSTRLWENLQKPFRADREKQAKLAQLDAESSVKAQELQHSKKRQTAQLETESELSHLRATKDAERFDREQKEQMRRYQKEQEAERQAVQEKNISEQEAEEAHLALEQKRLNNSLALSKARKESEHEEILKDIELKIKEAQKEVEALEANFKIEQQRAQLDSDLKKQNQQAELQLKELLHQANLALITAKNKVNNEQQLAEIGAEEKRQKIYNDLSPNHLQSKLLEELPGIAAQLPRPNELKSISIGSQSGAHDAQALTSLVSQLFGIFEAFKGNTDEKKEGEDSLSS